MNIEIQVALNFLISFLYNKLPRRRVNQFGDELDRALRLKFDGHWYPEKPYKGSAFRCLKTTPPLDPVFELAAREAGMDLADIQENLPQEVSIWVDPGEVSYRMSEKGPVKILYSERERSPNEYENHGREVTRTFNPEAQCFKPIESTMASQFGALSLNTSALLGHTSPPMPPLVMNHKPGPVLSNIPIQSPTQSNYVPKSGNSVTFTTAAFAQTKFGSTKLKSNSKRSSQRMSPTEFSNYIRQRTLLQHQSQHSPPGSLANGQHRLSGDGGQLFSNSNNNNNNGMTSPQHSRSISPEQPGSAFMSGISPSSSVSSAGSYYSHYALSTPPPSDSPPYLSSGDSCYEDTYLVDLLHQSQEKMSALGRGNELSRFSSSFMDKELSPFMSVGSSLGNESPTSGQNGKSAKAAFESLSMNGGISYHNQYQHLLVAN